MFYTSSLIVALMYTLGAILTKRAMVHGAGVLRCLFVSNLLIFVFMLILFGPNLEFKDPSGWPWVLLVGVAEFLGAVFVTLSIRTGDVSVQTPLMGTKILLVATFSLFLLPKPIPVTWWIGAVLACLAILSLGVSSLLKKGLARISVLYVVASCCCFALVDVVIEREAVHFGQNAFYLSAGIILFVLTLFCIPFFKGRLIEIPKKAWGWLLSGSILLALQLIGIFYLLGEYGQATVFNIFYSSRGVMSVLLIWFLGRWFGNYENASGQGVMLRRLGGAVLLMIAIVIILLSPEA